NYHAKSHSSISTKFRITSMLLNLRKTAVCCLVALFAVLLFVLSIPVCEQSSVRITICNASGAGLKEVQVKLSGLTGSVERLGPGAKFAMRARPTGESDVLLSFRDSMDQLHQTNAGVYLEPKFYYGTITAAIQSNGIVIWTNQIKTGLF
ncbi:MAG TPA: hypothetical protein PLW35_03325, partial [Verrucomicrobiota bacterium]|nr:hypothetical protein [Verrucomicrobiota bacterium]